MVKFSRIVLGLVISSALCLGFILTLTTEMKAHAATTPGGLWVTPTTDNTVYEPGIWYTIKARAYSPAGIDHVNFTAGDPWNRWYVFCNPTQPDPGTVDTYSCQTDFRPSQTGVYFGGGTIHLSFDVYGKDGGINYSPNGERTEIYKNSRLGGTWNSPSDGATYKVGDHIRFSANAYPSDGGHPIDHVAFTANYAGSWHTVCTQSYPNGHEFGCDWYPPANAAGNISVSFDVYTTNPGETSYAPNGVHTLHIQGLAIPGGMWIAPGADGFTFDLGTWYTFKAHAYPTNGGPSIAYVNFTGYWNNTWHIICSSNHIDSGTSDQFSCQSDFRAPNGGTYPGGLVTVSFDVYDSGGGVNHAPNGMHNGQFSNSHYGGTWNNPANNFQVVVGQSLLFSANAYPQPGSYPIDHVAFTANINGSWRTLCTQDRPNVHTFVCYWSPDSSISGSITVSFDVYYSNAGTITYVSYSPNGTHNGLVINPAKLSLKAPFPYGTKFTIVAGYNDNYGNVCTAGTPSDHCNNQLFGLDFAGSMSTLAPVGGVVTQIYQYQFQGQSRDCIFIQMDDNLNLSLCHILPNTLNTTNVFVGAKLVQGALIGNNDGHVHLNIDMREATGHCCNNYPPVPFTGYHTIEGVNFNPNHDSKGVPVTYLGTTYLVDQNEWQGYGGQSSN